MQMQHEYSASAVCMAGSFWLVGVNLLRDTPASAELLLPASGMSNSLFRLESSSPSESIRPGCLVGVTSGVARDSPAAPAGPELDRRLGSGGGDGGWFTKC